MYKILVCEILLLLFILFLLACVPKTAAPATVAPDTMASPALSMTSPATLALAEEASGEWGNTLQSARKEGKVVVYGQSWANVLKELAPRFTDKYGISLEVLIFGRGAEQVARLRAERSAGLFLADVITSGANSVFAMMKPAGLIDPLELALLLPGVRDPKNWYGGELYWLDKEHMLLGYDLYPSTPLAINTDLVKRGEIKSYYDLLDRRWKGKILMNDPTTTGTGLKSFSVVAFKILNLDFFRQLAKQEPMIIRDQRQQVEWLARGKYPVLLFPLTTPVREHMEAGAAVENVHLVEGTYLSSGGGNIAIVNRAPHPRAARILINWFLSKEGQTLASAIGKLHSARVDAPTEGLNPIYIRQPGMKYIVGVDTPEWFARDEEFVKAAQEILGHLIR